ncbi:MAG: hypothetical protein Q8P86_00325 [bacterium]|nr:hypothetical protein [bacterium]
MKKVLLAVVILRFLLGGIVSAQNLPESLPIGSEEAWWQHISSVARTIEIDVRAIHDYYSWTTIAGTRRQVPADRSRDIREQVAELHRRVLEEAVSEKITSEIFEEWSPYFYVSGGIWADLPSRENLVLAYGTPLRLDRGADGDFRILNPDEAYSPSLELSWETYDRVLVPAIGVARVQVLVRDTAGTLLEEWDSDAFPDYLDRVVRLYNPLYEKEGWSDSWAKWPMITWDKDAFSLPVEPCLSGFPGEVVVTVEDGSTVTYDLMTGERRRSALLSIKRAGSILSVRVENVQGQSVFLEHSTSISGPWKSVPGSPLQALRGNAQHLVEIESGGDSARFYRIASPPSAGK